MKRDIFENNIIKVKAQDKVGQESIFKNSNRFEEVHNISNSLHEHISKTLDEYAIEGLRRKGFEFKNDRDLHEFVKTRCRCADHVGVRQRTYYVDDIPFLLHEYSIGKIIEERTDRSITFKVTSSGFHYL